MGFKTAGLRRLGPIALLFLLVTACGPKALPLTPTLLIPRAADSPIPTKVPASNTPSAMPSSSKTPVPTNTGTPTLEPRIEGLQSNPPWLIISAKDGLWVSSMNGAHVVSLLDKSYESIDLHQSISPATHQIAVLTSVQDDPHSLGLELVFLLGWGPSESY